MCLPAGQAGKEGKMGDGETKKFLAVTPGAPVVPGATQPPGWVSHMVKNLLILGVGATEFTETRDLSYHETGGPSSRTGIFLLAARRSDGLWVVVKIVTQSGCTDKLIRGEPRGQILGLTLASDEPLYVGWPAKSSANRPRVYLGKQGEGKPYDTIDHKQLQWVNGKPLYPASEADKEFVVHGTREGERYDEIEPPILFVANRPLYRARLGKAKFLVWGTDKSKPCDSISPPNFNGREVVAMAIDGISKLHRLILKAA